MFGRKGDSSFQYTMTRNYAIARAGQGGELAGGEIAGGELAGGQ